MLPVISPALADDTLLNNQTLLKESASASYGSKPLDVKVVALNILKTVLTFIAVIMVALLMAAGFKYMTSGGNETQMKEAMGQIKALFVGLLIILASWSIVSYMLKWLVCSTTTTGTSCASIW
ncbi:MAG: hypothetical protein WC860_10180 [Candidatus Margulisiibacteriota bacterium]